VVVPREGLNVRSAPAADAAKAATARHGTFLQKTGREAVDANGAKWVEVRGPDANRKPVEGWVAADLVTSHPRGGEGAKGRVDWDLLRHGYTPVAVKPGDTLRDIAARFAARAGVSPADVVAVDGNQHVIDRDMIFPGDTVYLRIR
jgi:hypothetical protein